MCELISATVEEEKIRVDTHLCSVWGNMLAYLKCELAYFEFFFVDGIVTVAVKDQHCKCSIRTGITR